MQPSMEWEWSGIVFMAPEWEQGESGLLCLSLG